MFTVKNRIGIICSSGGSAFTACMNFLVQNGVSVLAVTDRPCGIEEKLQGHTNCKVKRIKYESIQSFSQSAKVFFDSEGGVDIVFLYFTKYVGAEIYTAYPTINIHPTLLPSFPGLHSQKALIEAGVKVIGVTGHLVDSTCDDGKILVQVANSISLTKDLNKTLYLQKIYVQMVLLDHYLNGRLQDLIDGKVTSNFINAHPSFITSKAEAWFAEFIEAEKVSIVR